MSKNKNILFCLFLCFVGAVLLLGSILLEHSIGYAYDDIIMNIYILSSEEQPTEDLSIPLQQPLTIYWNNTPLPYDMTTNTIYLPSSLLEQEWTGKLHLDNQLSKEGYVICGASDSYWYQKDAAIRDNHTFDLWLVKGNTNIPFHMVLTGTPMVSITTEREETEEIVTMDDVLYGDGTISYGQLILFDPNRSGDDYQIIGSNVKFHEKGGSTTYFDKKSYSFTLLKENGETQKFPLLGMRNDDDWKLNSLYTDEYRIREKTAAQLWEQIDDSTPELNEAGPRMEYIEVILDYEYLGLYALVEPVDAKKCDMQEGDVLYKIADLEVPKVKDLRMAALSGYNTWESVRIRYPKQIQDYHQAWDPLKSYLIVTEIAMRQKNPNISKLLPMLEISNVADYLIFTQVVAATDNEWKNIYYAAHRQEDNSYQMIQHPWDLDYTFGNDFHFNNGKPTDRIHDNYIFAYVDQASFLLFGSVFSSSESSDEEENMVSQQIQFLKNRYQNYRNSILSNHAIWKLLEENSSYLIETGAAQRESLRWTDRPVSTDLTELLAFQAKRLEWLDKCMGY